MVVGGGVTSQEEAIRLGLSRALIKFNPESRKELKGLGFLSRDARVVERKKYGLKRLVERHNGGSVNRFFCCLSGVNG